MVLSFLLIFFFRSNQISEWCVLPYPGSIFFISGFFICCSFGTLWNSAGLSLLNSLQIVRSAPVPCLLQDQFFVFFIMSTIISILLPPFRFFVIRGDPGKSFFIHMSPAGLISNVIYVLLVLPKLPNRIHIITSFQVFLRIVEFNVASFWIFVNIQINY